MFAMLILLLSNIMSYSNNSIALDLTMNPAV